MTKRQLTKVARDSLAALTTGVAGIVAEIVSRENETRAYVARRYVQVGIMLDEGAEVIAGGLTTYSDWREWATENVPGSPPTVYRIRQAGHVARIIAAGGGEIGEASYLAFFPLYRFVSSAKTDEDRAKGTAEILALWATLTADGHVPTADEVHSALEKAEKAGTRGRNAGDTAAAAKSRKAAKTRKAAKVAEQSVPTEEGSADREACGKALDSTLRRFADTPNLAGIYLAGILAGLKLRETYAATTCYAIAKDRANAARQAEKAAA